jgi:Mg2+ and Co2+ transporter CorA
MRTSLGRSAAWSVCVVMAVAIAAYFIRRHWFER